MKKIWQVKSGNRLWIFYSEKPKISLYKPSKSRIKFCCIDEAVEMSDKDYEKIRKIVFKSKGH